MKIEIWSDIVCPFCYIGKRNLEAALAQFEHRAEVQVLWRSFQLDPNLKAPKDTSVFAYLAAMKGQTLEWSVRAHERVAEMAENVGLHYRFDKAVVANSYDAHRILQLARVHKKDGVAKELLLHAYFVGGQDIADHSTLLAIGNEIGLDPNELERLLAGDAYGDDVRLDNATAHQLGASGVPFFVFDGEFAVVGAQPAAILLEALERAYANEPR